MARARNPDRDKAFEIYKKHDGKIELVQIAEMLNRPPGTIRGWKNKDNWEERLSGTFQKNAERSKRTKGGQPGNKNAVGHGAPEGNKNAEKHGFFSKYLPEDAYIIAKEIQGKDPLDLLWENIVIQYTAIIRAQRIMYVKDQNDKTVEKVGYRKGKVSGEEWEVQQAWDKQATFLKAQSRAMKTLESMLKQYDELLKSSLATEEQKLRIEKLRAEVNAMKGGGPDNDREAIDEFIKATTLSEADVKAIYEGEDNEITEETS